MRGGDLLGRVVGDVDAHPAPLRARPGPAGRRRSWCTAAAAGAAWRDPPVGRARPGRGAGRSAALGLPLMAGLAGRRAGRRQAPARAALGSEVLESRPARARAGRLRPGGRPDRGACARRTHDLARDLALGRRDRRRQRRPGRRARRPRGRGDAGRRRSRRPRTGGWTASCSRRSHCWPSASVEALAPLPEAARRLAATVTAARRIEEVTLAPAPVARPGRAAPGAGPRPRSRSEGARLRLRRRRAPGSSTASTFASIPAAGSRSSGPSGSGQDARSPRSSCASATSTTAGRRSTAGHRRSFAPGRRAAARSASASRPPTSSPGASATTSSSGGPGASDDERPRRAGTRGARRLDRRPARTGLDTPGGRGRRRGLRRAAVAGSRWPGS